MSSPRLNAHLPHRRRRGVETGNAGKIQPWLVASVFLLMSGLGADNLGIANYEFIERSDPLGRGVFVSGAYASEIVFRGKGAPTS